VQYNTIQYNTIKYYNINTNIQLYTQKLFACLALGKEHRSGRWWNTSRDQNTLGEACCIGARNCVMVLPFNTSQHSDNDDDSDSNNEHESDE